MIVHVQLFARARDLAGCDSISLAVADGAVAADVRRALARACPGLAGLVERSALALDDEYVEEGNVIPPDADLALLPPVSGG